MIDLSQLRAIAGDTPELILEILEDFKQDASAKLDEASGFLSAHSYPEAQSKFHQLAGASGTLGLSGFYEKVRVLEAQCQGGKGNEADVQAVRDLLAQSVEEARAALIP